MLVGQLRRLGGLGSEGLLAETSGAGRENFLGSEPGAAPAERLISAEQKGHNVKTI